MRSLPALALLAACANPDMANGRWIGPLVPATPGPACPPSTGVAQFSANRLIFTPDEGTWVLQGAAAPDGTVTAERTRQGADKQPFTTKLAAKWTQQTVTGTYTTPRCTYAVNLTRR